MAIQLPCAVFRACLTAETKDILLPRHPGWKVRLYDSPEAIQSIIPQSWQQSKWLRGAWMAYLSGNLASTPNYWVELDHKNGHRLGLTVQVLNFQAGKQIRQAEKSGFSWRRWLARPLRFKALVLGQLLNSGPFGWTGAANLPAEEWQDLLPDLGDELARHFCCSGVVLKDLVEETDPVARHWETAGYQAMPVDPVMILPIRSHWHSIEDYLLDLSSKYRVRYRRARRELSEIDQRVLPLLEVRKRSAELDALFEQVRSEAAFDPVDPEAGYFFHLQQEWGDACEIVGYFEQERLVGFTTSLRDGYTLHAHYLGFEEAANERYRLYHNMLFDLAETAILSGVRELNYARTALEIKSSIGADFKHYAVLVKARSSFINWMVRRFTPRLFQAKEWQPRNPFRHKEIVQLP